MMKDKVVALLATLIFAILIVACGSSNGAENIEMISTEVDFTVTSEGIEAPHEHAYTEAVVTPATCTTDGESTFTCECGDTYTEATPATGHDFSNYISNEDATYESDGTETATCACGETDTRVAEGSMLTYSFEEMAETKYAKSTVNVRSLPTSDGEKLGGLSTNDEVKVTGKCNETGWYRIEYSDGIAYVSDEYLVDEKVEAKASTPAASSLPTYATYAEAKAYAISLGYPIASAVDNGDGTVTLYWMGVSNGTHQSYDFEWGTGRCDDYTRSYQVGWDILGYETGNEGNYKWVKIAHTSDPNWDWEVASYKMW